MDFLFQARNLSGGFSQCCNVNSPFVRERVGRNVPANFHRRKNFSVQHLMLSVIGTVANKYCRARPATIFNITTSNITTTNEGFCDTLKYEKGCRLESKWSFYPMFTIFGFKMMSNCRNSCRLCPTPELPC